MGQPESTVYAIFDKKIVQEALDEIKTDTQSEEGKPVPRALPIKQHTKLTPKSLPPQKYENQRAVNNQGTKQEISLPAKPEKKKLIPYDEETHPKLKDTEVFIEKSTQPEQVNENHEAVRRSVIDEIVQAPKEQVTQDVLIPEIFKEEIHADVEKVFDPKPIDTFVFANTEQTKTFNDIQVVFTEGKVIFGGEKAIDAQPTPIVTLGELEHIIDFIDMLVSPLPLSQENSEIAPVTQENIALSELVILVSEDILTFIESEIKVIEKADDDADTSLQTTEEETKEIVEKHYITISSGQREMVVELTLLKQLIALHKLKQERNHSITFESLTALEELGLHTVSSSTQSWNMDASFWLVYQLLLFSLISIDDNQFFLPRKDKLYHRNQRMISHFIY